MCVCVRIQDKYMCKIHYTCIGGWGTDTAMKGIKYAPLSPQMVATMTLVEYSDDMLQGGRQTVLRSKL